MYILFLRKLQVVIKFYIIFSCAEQIRNWSQFAHWFVEFESLILPNLKLKFGKKNIADAFYFTKGDPNEVNF